MKRLLLLSLILISISATAQWQTIWGGADIKNNGNYSAVRMNVGDTCVGSINAYNNGFDGMDISAGNCYSAGAWQFTTPHAAQCLFFNLQDSTLEFWSEANAGGVGSAVSWSARKMWIDFDGGVHATSVVASDSLGIGSEYVDGFTYLDSITTNIGNSTTGVPNAFIDTIHQNGLATVKIAVSLADDETYNLPDAKNVFGKVLTGANYVDFFIQTDGTSTLAVSSGSTANSDSDGTSVCVYDGGSYGIIKNRSGGALTFLISYSWEY